MTLSTQRHLPLLLAAGIAASVSIQTASAQTVVTQWDQFAMAGITAAGPAMDELIGTCEPDLNGATVLRTIAPSIGIRDSYRLAVSANKTPDLAYTWPAASVLAGYAGSAPLPRSMTTTRSMAGRASTTSTVVATASRAPSMACRWSRI